MAFQSREDEETMNNDKSPPLMSHLVTAKGGNERIPKNPFDILNNYRGHAQHSRRRKLINEPVPQTKPSGTFACQGLPSAEIIVGLAKMRLLQETSQKNGDFSPSQFHSCDSCQNIKNVELIFLLLKAAEKISNQEFDSAEELMNKCILDSSPASSPVQRVVKYFSEALHERANTERGKFDLEMNKMPDLGKIVKNYGPAVVVCEEKLPVSQVTHFTAIQVILDAVGEAKNIHLVDFGIKHGLHWPVLMQGLANRKNCPLELLRITAIGANKGWLDEIGEPLSSFAASMSLPFAYKPVVSESTGLPEDLVGFQADEVVVVHSELYLWFKLAHHEHLKTFIKFIKKLNPCVLVVNEFEASTDTDSFIQRFYGVLTYTVAMFDCLETCLKGHAISRKTIEDVFFKDMIRNIVTAEDEERYHRHAKIGFWRVFEEFGLVETELSTSSLYQANLLVERNSNWDFCSLAMNGKCMTVGWKGTPLRSVSAWKVINDEMAEPDSN